MIHKEQPPGDILVFLTGEDEIEVTCIAHAHGRRRGVLILCAQDACAKLRSANLDPDVAELKCLPCYASLPPDRQQLIFEPAPGMPL